MGNLTGLEMYEVVVGTLTLLAVLFGMWRGRL